MTLRDLPDVGGRADVARAFSPDFCLLAHVAAVFASAFLLFSIQPMFTKMVLPQLGGTPAVWSVAMVFFQGLLLVGYLYAHLMNTWLSGRRALIVHLCVLTAALLSCPISLAAGFGKPPASGESFWLLSIFFVSVGLPFFAVATNGPLLQAWFSRAGHAQSGSPWFLYGASNLGSFSALLLYPVLIEPFASLREQALAWSLGYAGFILLIAVCGIFVWRAGWRAVAPAPAAAPVPLARKLAWAGYAFVPSGLLVAVTAHISTDIATAPFLWVVPLAIFLLTFVLVFRERPTIPHRWIAAAVPAVVFALALIEITARANLAAMLGGNLLMLFLAAMLCHGGLYRRRPEASGLTEFYLFVSLGGVLGGVFTGLVAPQVFSGVTEYPILVIAALLCLPFRGGVPPLPRLSAQCAFGAVLTLAVFTALSALPPDQPALKTTATVAVFALCGAVVWLERRSPVLVASAVAVLFGLSAAHELAGGGYTVRSFFGVKKISVSADGQFRQMAHGSTIHGAIRIANADGSTPSGRPKPSTYYTEGSPLGRAIAGARAAAGGALGSVAVAGLGAGSLACHQHPGEAWSYFEIDPQIVALAREPSLFRFLRDCAPDARVVVGDARLTLAEETGRFDAIVLDAFSSDAIPIHLVTEEAFRLYLSRLNARGLLVLHVSNRYLALEPFIGAIADRLGLSAVTMHQRQGELTQAQKDENGQPSVVIALARDASSLSLLAGQPGWRPLPSGQKPRVWTDDYSNILASILRRYQEPAL